MTPTELALLACHRSPVIALEHICKDHLGVGYERACELAALNRLPLPTFRLTESKRAPLMVHYSDLAAFIDSTRETAAASWERSQL